LYLVLTILLEVFYLSDCMLVFLGRTILRS